VRRRPVKCESDGYGSSIRGNARVPACIGQFIHISNRTGQCGIPDTGLLLRCREFRTPAVDHRRAVVLDGQVRRVAGRPRCDSPSGREIGRLSGLRAGKARSARDKKDSGSHPLSRILEKTLLTEGRISLLGQGHVRHCSHCFFGGLFHQRRHDVGPHSNKASQEAREIR